MTDRPPRVLHVWVRLDYVPEPLPGLLVEWEKRADGWWARVAHGRGSGVTMEWVSSAKVTKLESRPFTGSAYG